MFNSEVLNKAKPFNICQLQNARLRHTSISEKLYLLILKSLAGDDVFFALRCVEVDWKLDALRLVHSQW